MQKPKVIAAAALTAALATGGVVGAALGSPGVSGAQDQAAATTTTVAGQKSTTSGDKDSSHRGGRRGGWGKGVELEAAAKALGMSEEDLRTQLRDGKSLADVAKDKGVDRQKLIDAMVAAGEKRLDEAKAKLPERMAEMVDRSFDAAGFIDRLPIIGPGFEAAAKTLGMSEKDVLSSLRDGKSLADLAKDKGVDRQKLIDAIVADAKAKLAEKVAAGKLTQAQADKMTERLTDMAGRLVDGKGPFGGHGGRGPWRGGPDGPDAGEGGNGGN